MANYTITAIAQIGNTRYEKDLEWSPRRGIAWGFTRYRDFFPDLNQSGLSWEDWADRKITLDIH